MLLMLAAYPYVSSRPLPQEVTEGGEEEFRKLSEEREKNWGMENKTRERVVRAAAAPPTPSPRIRSLSQGSHRRMRAKNKTL